MNYPSVWLLTGILLIGEQFVTIEPQKMLNLPPCPTVTMSATETSPDSPLIIEADVIGFAHANAQGITYNWTISAGRIINGQGTPRIKINKTELRGKTVGITLEVGGLSKNCVSLTPCEVTISRQGKASKLRCE
jgi:hypothetical protein